ncbi:MAG: RES family NAD+ phosphorylase [Pigmentiphaga sp.]|uniref:RES family NAD+ phosphorylase n=1 Tax=Pigmentiphaga sp. TaxID=1977564 RepID=UPI0029A92109|nr:RES family NAD+ phosphorylase [Pigmentiphaga sp.]MDX3906045.1 RES family NAD+ phosphorylase [Pigmentiphaga sp.]
MTLAVVSDVQWTPCHRLVPSRFPPTSLYDRVADPADLDVVFAIENLTNPRVRDEAGHLHLVPPEERVSGPGTTPIMAAFTHLNPEGSRFTDGTWGVYYAGESLETAVAETMYHRSVFLAATREPAIEIDMRHYLADLAAPLHDLRGRQHTLPEIYDPDNYAASQAFARELRREGSWGVAYDSVRRPGGQCAAVFRPRALSRCRQSQHIAFVWDGTRMSGWYSKSALRSV